MATERGRSVFSRDEPSVGHHPTPSGQPSTHGHVSNTRWTEFIYVYIDMYVCMCVTVIIKEEVINLLGSGGKETREKLEGGCNHVNTILMHEILKKKGGVKKIQNLQTST